MYVPAHFALSDTQIIELLTSMGTGELVTLGPDGLVATRVPMLFDPTVGEHGALLCHLQRNNTQWQHTATEALVIIDGPQHYVSPTWYPDGQAGTVPTWDYVTVHVYGDLIAHDDLAWTGQVVRRLTDHHEGRSGSGRPEWSVDEAAPGYVDAMLRAVVGLELQITRIEAKAKMAQNKAPADVVALAELLAAEGDAEGERWLRDVSLPAAQARADTLAALRR